MSDDELRALEREASSGNGIAVLRCVDELRRVGRAQEALRVLSANRANDAVRALIRTAAGPPSGVPGGAGFAPVRPIGSMVSCGLVRACARMRAVPPLDWLSDDVRVLATLVVEVALAAAILRFVIHRRRSRILAGVALVIALGLEGLMYDYFIALPVLAGVSEGVGPKHAILAICGETRTRFLGITLLRVLVLLRDPDDPEGKSLQMPQGQYNERRTTFSVLNHEFSGIDRIFLLTLRPNAKTLRVDELSPGPIGHLSEKAILAEIAAIASTQK